MKLAAYARASTDEQEESTDVQLAMIREYCTRNNHEIVAEYIDDGVSGGLECAKRPGASKMLDDARKKQFQGIVARSNRRLGRDTIDLLVIRREAKKRNLSLLFVTQTFGDDAQGDFMFSVMASIGELERKLTGERIRNHNRHLAQLGRWPAGRPPLGYVYDKETKTISVDPDRARDAVALFREFLACGGNRMQTSKRLNSLGIKTRDGNLWSDDAIADALRNPLYRGFIAYQEIRTPIDIERIIPQDLIDRVDSMLENTAHIRQRSNPRTVYPFSGVLICSKCGSTMKAHKINRQVSYSYVCRGNKEKGICNASSIGCGIIDRLAGMGLEEALTRNLEMIRQAATEAADSRPTDASAGQKRRLMDSRNRLVDLYASGIIEKGDLEQRLVGIDKQLLELNTEKPASKLTESEVVSLLDDWPTRWQEYTPEEKRGLVLVLCPRIYVDHIARQSTTIIMDTTLGAGMIEVKSVRA